MHIHTCIYLIAQWELARSDLELSSPVAAYLRTHTVYVAQNQKRAADLDERRKANRERAEQQLAKLYDTLAVQQFMADCDDVEEWLEEKMIAAQDETYRYVTSVK